MKTSEDKIQQLVERSGRKITEREVQADGTIKLSTDVCFFDESHRNCSAVFIRPETGEAYYNCFHNSCKAAGKEGRWLRDAFKRYAPELLKDTGFRKEAKKEEKEDLPELDIITARIFCFKILAVVGHGPDASSGRDKGLVSIVEGGGMLCALCVLCG